MAKKGFLSRERTIPSAQIPSISKEEIASTSKNNPWSEQLPFMILEETSKSIRNASGRILLIKFNSPVEEQNPGTYLQECIIGLTNYLVNDVPGRDLVGLRNRNTENTQDKVVGISLHRRDLLNPDVVWPVLGKVIQSNGRFGLSARLEVHLDHVMMPAGNDRVRTKKCIVTVKAALNHLAYAFIIDTARVNCDPKYQSCRDGKGLKNLLKIS